MDYLEWSTPEHEHKDRSTDWYWGLGLGSLIFAGVCVYFENYLLAILVVVSATTLAIFSIRRPRIVTYTISADGVQIDHTLYPFSTLESFWVEEMSHPPKIILASKKILVPYIIIPITDHNPRDVRELLHGHLTEVEHHEPLLQVLIERFGF